MKCPYCNRDAELMDGTQVYPRRADLRVKNFWVCVPCGAHVGCHGDTSMPLGTLADAKLRRARNKAHEAFDIIWKSGKLTRSEAYFRLSRLMGIRKKDAHIAMFDERMCQRARSSPQRDSHITWGSKMSKSEILQAASCIREAAKILMAVSDTVPCAGDIIDGWRHPIVDELDGIALFMEKELFDLIVTPDGHVGEVIERPCCGEMNIGRTYKKVRGLRKMEEMPVGTKFYAVAPDVKTEVSGEQ